MSAPDEAYEIAPDGKDIEGKDLKHIKVYCPCSWSGHVGQLLGVDDTETMWCPYCRTSAWTYQ